MTSLDIYQKQLFYDNIFVNTFSEHVFLRYRERFMDDYPNAPFDEIVSEFFQFNSGFIGDRNIDEYRNRLDPNEFLAVIEDGILFGKATSEKTIYFQTFIPHDWAKSNQKTLVDKLTIERDKQKIRTTTIS